MSTDMFPQGFIDYMMEHGPVSEHCRAGCPTQDHRTWGECVRAANIGVNKESLKASDRK